MTIKSDFETRKKKGGGAESDLFLHDWDGLRAFLDVARSNSLSAAAAGLNLQYTTLSRRITALEEALGRPLLVRGPRGIQLTPDGAELLTVLERFDEDLQGVGRWIKRGVRGMDRPINVNIACTEGLSAYWLTHFMSALRKRNVRACYNIHASLEAKVEKGRPFHASVQMHQPVDAEAPEQIGYLHFTAMASRSYVEEMGPYKPGDHPGNHRWIEFAPFRVSSGSWETWFQRERIEVAPFTVTNSLVTTVNSVAQGVGIGLLPAYMAITDPDLVPMNTGLRPRFPIWLSVDPKSSDTPESSAALGLIRAAIDPPAMPWFRDRLDPEPDYESWRGIMKTAIGRLA